MVEPKVHYVKFWKQWNSLCGVDKRLRNMGVKTYTVTQTKIKEDVTCAKCKRHLKLK